MSEHEFIVNQDDEHSRVDVFLTKHFPDVPSRRFIQKLISQGDVLISDAKVKANHKVSVGDVVVVKSQDVVFPLEKITPENIPLDVFYEDEGFVVINKPSGMVVHPAPGNYTGTLVNALLYHYQQLSDFNALVRPGIVHRLDQDTSGLILVAKNNQIHARLARLFQKHRVYKKYLALVEGVVEFEEGKIDAPLGTNLYHREKKAVRQGDGKEAITLYRVVKRGKRSTLVALYPQTGRTHQLRVHMAYMKHPILGDEKYGRKATFPRLALHAQAIGFEHPQHKQYVEFMTKCPVEFNV